MSEINEISRRSLYHEDDGIACGPASCTAIVAEIVVEADEKPVYLYGEWIDIVDEYSFEANPQSLYEFQVKINEAESYDDQMKAIEELNKVRENSYSDDSIFEPYYEELKKMIQDEMKKHGLDHFINEDEEE